MAARLSFLGAIFLLISGFNFGFNLVAFGSGIKPSPRIIDGKLAENGQFPWFAGVMSLNATSYKQLCGGALIYPDWILTAAHCVNNSISVKINLGSVNISAPALQIVSSEYVIHPDYNSTTKRSDIALVHLPFKVELNDFVQLIPLPTRAIAGNELESHMGIVCGHGRIYKDRNNVSQLLRWTFVNVITNEDCMKFYGPNVIVPTTLCATAALHERNVCNGDSGGPLIIQIDANFYHVGVIAFTPVQGCEVAPGGYMRTSSYLDWIEEVTQIEIAS